MEKIKLGLFSSHADNFEYLNGKVKEVHYKAYHLTNENGEMIVGKPFTFVESQNVALRQPWSYYFNETGQIIYSSAAGDNGNRWTGVYHYDNDGRLDNIYWLKEDTLMFNHDIVYHDDGKVERKWIEVRTNNNTGSNVYLLDKMGNIQEQMFVDPGGNIGYSGKFKRDSEGKITKMMGYNGQGDIINDYSDYKYNEKGLFVSAHMNILGGNKHDQTMAPMFYEFDDHGNWIKRYDKVWLLVERDIVYYE